MFAFTYVFPDHCCYSVFVYLSKFSTRLFPFQTHLSGSNPSTPTSTQPPTSMSSSGSQAFLLERQDSNLSTG